MRKRERSERKDPNWSPPAHVSVPGISPILGFNPGCRRLPGSGQSVCLLALLASTRLRGVNRASRSQAWLLVSPRADSVPNLTRQPEARSKTCRQVAEDLDAMPQRVRAETTGLLGTATDANRAKVKSPNGGNQKPGLTPRSPL